MLSRPKPRENEEDLLRFQEEFLKSSSKSTAAAVVRVDKRKTEDDGSGEIKNSVQETNSTSAPMESMMDTSEVDQTSEGGVHSSKRVKFKQDEEAGETAPFRDALEEIVLKDIVEKDTASWKPILPSAPKGQPFPKVFRRDKKFTTATAQQQSISIFAQQMQALREKKSTSIKGDPCKAVKAKNVGLKVCSAHNQDLNKVSANLTSTESVTELHPSTDLSAILGNTSVMVDGTGLEGDNDKQAVVKEIHEENLNKLATMSQADILKEQQHLMGMLSPDIIRFLKLRRNQPAAVERISTHTTPKKSISNIDSEEKESVHASTFMALDQEVQSKSAIADSEMKPTESKDIQSVPTIASTVVDKEVSVEMPIPLQEAKKWLNMDKLETEKLAWTTCLPKPEPIDPKSGYPARFDFNGILVLHDADVPTHLGLHHHGEEPEIPGYTLEELFIYGRSAILQQRTLALSTLARILSKCKEGWYDTYLSEPLLPQLLDAGLVLLLRWALDDNNETSFSSALATLHALIVSVPDEICLERSSLWFRGEEVPSLQPEAAHGSDIEGSKGKDNTTEDELSDAELVKLDVIKGLIRMDVLPRLRYILEVVRPSAGAVVQILEILSRIACHSLDSAFAVTRCPRLLSTIVTEFLPKTWSSAVEEQGIPGKLTYVYGVPVPQAVKLIRSLANAGRHIAEDLLHRYDIMSSLLCYASIDPFEGYLPTKEALTLCLASYSTWRTFLIYGLTVQSYLDFYPLIVRQLQFYQTLCVNMDLEKNAYNFDHAASLLSLLTVTIKLTLVKSSFELKSRTLLEWTQVEGLYVTVELCVKKWLWELERADAITHSASRLVGAALNFIAEFYDASTKQTSYNSIEVLDKIEKFYNSSVIPFMESKVFEKMLSQIRQFSLLLCQTPSGKKRDPSMLPSLGSILWGGQLNPVLEEMSPFAFLTEYMHCVYVCNCIHCGLSTKINLLLLDNSDVTAYLRQLVPSVSNNMDINWFSRFETHFVYYLMAICALKKCSYPRIYHEAALQSLQTLQRGDDEMVHQLLEMVVFNAKFISEFDDITSMLEELKLKENDGLVAPSLEKVEISTMKLLHHTCLCLPSICSTYQSYFTKYVSMQRWSRWKKSDSLSIPHVFVPLVPADFAYLPITLLHKMTTSQSAAITTFFDCDQEAATIHCLQWCHLLECWRKDVVGMTAAGKRFCFLAVVLLMSCDLFMHSEVRRYLEGCLRKMANRNELTALSWNKNPVPGFSSFYDLYIQLLEQFEAISYGDHLFGMFILIPLQRHHSVQVRRAIWTEHNNAARILGVSIKELLVPLQNFLIPIEDDSEMLLCYFKALLNGYVQPKWCPILYVIAVHHLHHFIFGNAMKDLHTELRCQMLFKLEEVRHKMISTHLLGYLRHNADSELGFDYTEEHSEMVKVVIEQVKT